MGNHTNTIQIPSVSLPQGGGGVRGIDEKFQVNSANGTSSFSVPVPSCSSRGFALCHACAVSVTTVEFFRLLLY